MGVIVMPTQLYYNWVRLSTVILLFFYFIFFGRHRPVKNYAGRQLMRVPIALHNTPSAMGLLHTIPPALLITERDRPGKCSKSYTSS